MTDVKLEIAGRDYTVACAPGEEQHIAMLGRMIDSKLSTLPNIAGQSDVRRLLYAALLLADELHERQGEQPEEPHADTAETLEALAERLEGLAYELEAGRGDQPSADQPSPQ